MASTLLLTCLALTPSVYPGPLPAAVRREADESASLRQAETLARHLRAFVLEFLPDPLFEDGKKWGMQKPGAGGKLKNHGRWLKYRIAGRDLAQTLQLRVMDLVKGEGPTRFRVVIDFDAGALLERQTWKMGLRVYSGSTRARFHVHLALDCEMTSRLEKGKGWFPEVIFSLKITGSEFRHDKIVVEHTAGVGGDGAKLLGDLLLEILKAVRPNLERDLATKVNAAIRKAGESKEVRLSFDELLGKSAKPPAQKK